MGNPNSTHPAGKSARKNIQLRCALVRCPQVRINSPESAAPHILNLSVRGVKGAVFQRALIP